MKNITKKLSALVLTTVFASMQVSMAAIDTGLGTQHGGAVINNATSGLVDVTKGAGTADLNFNASTHVNWNTLNVDKGEALNFNAVNGAKNLTVLNTVNQGMTNIYGQVNANSGISKLIISNPNGVLFDGASFATAGDTLITTQPMTANFVNGAMKVTNVATGETVGVVTVKDSDFTIGGEFNILAPAINAVASNVKADNGVKFVTANGQDYLSTGNAAPTDAVRLEAMTIDGDVYIVSDKGYVKTVTGGEIKGNLTVKSDDSVSLNYVDNGKALHVTGDVDATGNGVLMYARNTKVDGNLNMKNGGGFLEVGNVQVGKDMNLTTVAQSENAYGYKHFTHVVGNNTVEGNVNIQSKDNIHIGNYNFEEGRILDGSLKVGGDLTAHAQDGHVTVTIDTNANKIDLKSDNLNVLSDGKAVLTAKEYKFSSNGYIGSLADYTNEAGETSTTAQQVISVMENYTFIPKDIKSHDYIKVAGGEITQINTPGNAYIASNGDLKVTGANANDVNLTAYRSKIEITGPDVHAKNINVGPETDYLKLDFPGRDFTTNYTNIKDGVVTTVRPDEVITYELTDGPNGYNQPTLTPSENTTYLIGPGKEIDPVPPTPTPTPDIPDNENAKNLMARWTPDDIMQAPVNTPVAFAADLDDDDVESPIRKNVDGSVTVVRAFPMGK